MAFQATFCNFFLYLDICCCWSASGCIPKFQEHFWWYGSTICANLVSNFEMILNFKVWKSKLHMNLLLTIRMLNLCLFTHSYVLDMMGTSKISKKGSWKVDLEKIWANLSSALHQAEKFHQITIFLDHFWFWFFFSYQLCW